MDEIKTGISKGKESGSIRVDAPVSMQKYPFACFAIWGKSGMYMDEICVCKDSEPLEDMLPELHEDNPDEDYKVVLLFAH